MRFDPTKLRDLRERSGYTQETLAAASLVSVRTIQRAEAGMDLSPEAIGGIAAVLQIDATELMFDNDANLGSVPANVGSTIALRVQKSGRAVLEMLDSVCMAHLDCDVDPTTETLPLLKEAILLLEGQMPDPLDEEKIVWPRRCSLVVKLEAISSLNDVLEKLGEAGIRLFMGKCSLQAVMPEYTDEGFFSTRVTQAPERVVAVRMLLSRKNVDRIVTDTEAQWPVETVAARPPSVDPFWDEIDDTAPF